MRKNKLNYKKLKYIVLILFLIIFISIISIILLNSISSDSIQNILIINDSPILSENKNKFNINEIFLKDNEITNVSTVYSVLYKNDLNRNMYVFAVPVRDKGNDQNSIFDEKIYINDFGNYSTANKDFNVTFNDNSIDLHYLSNHFSIELEKSTVYKKEEIYLSLYGQKREGVKYIGIFENIDAIFIPTYNGLMIEFNIQEINDLEQIELKIDIGSLSYENDDAGYIQMLNDNDKKGMIYQGIVTDRANNLSVCNKVKIQKKRGDKYLVIDLKQLPDGLQYPITLSINFDFYLEKMFFDTSVYEDTPNINCLLNNITIFDAINDGHAGYTYVKYNIKSITPKDSSLLDSITYNFYVMYLVDKIDLEIYKVDRNWCSWTLTWNNKTAYKEKIGEITISNTGWYELDITEYVKELIDNNYDNLDDNSFVIKVKDGNIGYVLIASADNTFSPPYFEVNYRVS